MPVRRLRGRLPTIPPDILAGLEIDSTPSPIHDVEGQLEQALWCRAIAENAGLADPNVGRHVVIGERKQRVQLGMLITQEEIRELLDIPQEVIDDDEAAACRLATAQGGVFFVRIDDRNDSSVYFVDAEGPRWVAASIFDFLSKVRADEPLLSLDMFLDQHQGIWEDARMRRLEGEGTFGFRSVDGCEVFSDGEQHLIHRPIHAEVLRETYEEYEETSEASEELQPGDFFPIVKCLGPVWVAVSAGRVGHRGQVFLWDMELGYAPLAKDVDAFLDLPEPYVEPDVDDED